MDDGTPRRKPYTLYRAHDGAQPGDASGPGAVGAGARPPRGRQPSRRERRRRLRRRRLLAAAGLVVVLALVAALTLSAIGLLRHKQTGGDAKGGQAVTGAAAAGAAHPSPSAAALQKPHARFTITAGGDVIGGFALAAQFHRSGAAVLAHIAPYFKKSDFGFVNLESPLTDAGDPQTWKDVVIKGDPALAPALAESGVNVVNMANNHAGDQGDSGMLDTFAAVKAQHITLVGAGVDLAQARAGRIRKTTRGLKVGFLGFTDVLPVGYPATATSPGVSPGRADLGAATAAISAAARRAPFVIVAWHWNLEYKTAPTSLETSEGHAAIDAGADIVFAHHPHVLDGVERYHGGLIFYSLGNLAFSGFAGTGAETILVQASVTKRRIRARLVPVLISPLGVPSVATGSDAARILGRVKSLSAALGTVVTIRGDYGWVRAPR
jgi:poly-gamma-glutamate capsule biosynthesis protein CapA/YwtB (metallophosphatase superfamily)